METYKQARERLIREAFAHGWQFSGRHLKTPWLASSVEGQRFRVWFKPQAVYCGIDHHLGHALSLGVDIRGLAFESFRSACHRKALFLVSHEQRFPRS